MAFWGIEVKPGRPYTHCYDKLKGRLHVSQATLGNGTSTVRCLLQCDVGNKRPVFLCSLFSSKTESCQLNLEFDEDEDVIFSVIGPLSVHLTGYFLEGGRRHNGIEDSESYGEDIADTNSEQSPLPSDEDKYEGSFINDGDVELQSSSDEDFESKPKSRRRKSKSRGSGRLRNFCHLSDTEEEESSEQTDDTGKKSSYSPEDMESNSDSEMEEVSEKEDENRKKKSSKLKNSNRKMNMSVQEDRNYKIKSSKEEDNKGKIDLSMTGSEDDDWFTASSLLKSNGVKKSDVKEKAYERTSEKVKSNGEDCKLQEADCIITNDQCTTPKTKRKVKGDGRSVNNEQNMEQENDLDSKTLIEVVPGSHLRSKCKKRKLKAEGESAAFNGSHDAIDDGEGKNHQQENDHGKDDVSKPLAEVLPETGMKPKKKRRKEKAEGKSFESNGFHDSSVDNEEKVHGGKENEDLGNDDLSKGLAEADPDSGAKPKNKKKREKSKVKSVESERFDTTAGNEQKVQGDENIKENNEFSIEGEVLGKSKSDASKARKKNKKKD